MHILAVTYPGASSYLPAYIWNYDSILEFKLVNYILASPSLKLDFFHLFTLRKPLKI
jgi:hypothetical protein